MLMGAPRNALRAFNAGVSLTCLYVVARKLPHLLCGLVFVAHLFCRSPILRTCNRFLGAPAVWLGTDQNVSVCLILRKVSALSFSRIIQASLAGKRGQRKGNLPQDFMPAKL